MLFFFADSNDSFELLTGRWFYPALRRKGAEKLGDLPEVMQCSSVRATCSPSLPCSNHQFPLEAVICIKRAIGNDR